MTRAAAPLAAAFLALATLAVAGCGGGGAEPGAPQGATLVLDFTPNAVHTGIYVAKRRGYLSDAGVELTIREPSASTDAPKLLAAGRTDFAILDINDLGIALERGLPLVPVAGLVDRPLGAVIAQPEITSPRVLDGRTVGVTGLPSDEAVLDTEVRSDGGDVDSVRRVTIGFNAVAALAAGRVDAATAFWNAEGVALRRRGVDVNVFRVDDYGAPRFPELVLTTTVDTYKHRRRLVDRLVDAIRRGYRYTEASPAAALDDLLAEVPDLDPEETAAELHALGPALPRPGLVTGGPLFAGLAAWGRWAAAHGIVKSSPVRRFGLADR